MDGCAVEGGHNARAGFSVFYHPSTQINTQASRVLPACLPCLPPLPASPACLPCLPACSPTCCSSCCPWSLPGCWPRRVCPSTRPPRHLGSSWSHSPMLTMAASGGWLLRQAGFGWRLLLLHMRRQFSGPTGRNRRCIASLARVPCCACCSMGVNLGEAVNFAPPDWLRFGAAALGRLRHFRKPGVVSQEEMLLRVAAGQAAQAQAQRRASAAEAATSAIPRRRKTGQRRPGGGANEVGSRAAGKSGEA